MSVGNTNDMPSNDDCIVFRGVVGDEESENLVRYSSCWRHLEGPGDMPLPVVVVVVVVVAVVLFGISRRNQCPSTIRP